MVSATLFVVSLMALNRRFVACLWSAGVSKGDVSSASTLLRFSWSLSQYVSQFIVL